MPPRQQLEETARAAAMLHVGPARLADGRQVETVGRRKEFGLVGTKPAAGLGFRLHARVLRTRSVGFLQESHGGGEGDLGEITAHVGFPTFRRRVIAMRATRLSTALIRDMRTPVA